MLNRLPLIAMLLIIITGCTTHPRNDPKVTAEFKKAQSNINQCLFDELVKFLEVTPEPEMAIKVAATRCEYTALLEAERLQEINAQNGYGGEIAEFMLGIPNSSNSYTDGFTKAMTDKENIEDQARNVLMMMIEESHRQ